MHNLVVRPLTLSEFSLRRSEYEAVLHESAADSLFHSFDWLELWWKHFGKPERGEVVVILAAERHGALVGVLPVIQHIKVLRGPFQYRSSSILGNIRSSNRGIPTEYTTVVALPGSEEAVLRACLGHWRQHCTDREFVAGWSSSAALWKRGCESIRTYAWEAIRTIDPMTSHGVDLRNGLSDYAARLSGSARRSMFNLRRRLIQAVGLSFREIAPSSAMAALEHMNALHAQRWMSPAFTGDRLSFHQELVERWAAVHRVKFSELLANSHTISILYDIRWNDRQYNVQMGFDTNALPVGSPGVLHLGYAMEQAAEAGVCYYDFLAGRGMRSDYKRRYANTHVNLETVQYLRGPLLNLAMRIANGISS